MTHESRSEALAAALEIWPQCRTASDRKRDHQAAYEQADARATALEVSEQGRRRLDALLAPALERFGREI